MPRRGTKARARRSLLLAFGLTIGIGGEASAQTASAGQGDPQRGFKIAEKLCIGCHRISPDQSSSGLADVPSFAEIANRRGRTAQRIIDSMMLPHPSMPDPALTTATMSDLAAYILTFKKPD